ncbi:uncharacterized protein LOC128171426 [Crassostrea angulata]|uniref:uncharacterized protein LOC128171426 n=1 Tax=Magallana angulata TaxID=2784310 RepID=UPI0022B0A73E|nr:uncharacterized protein LOC128171426 [Crassostrea angulata]
MALDWLEEHEQGTSIALSLHWLPQQPNESEKLRTSTTHKIGLVIKICKQLTLVTRREALASKVVICFCPLLIRRGISALIPSSSSISTESRKPLSTTKTSSSWNQPFRSSTLSKMMWYK